uniref:TAR DNA-binding protein 43 N-terminal domain-containing protein n=1 Tax=Romanomermis culicivorax TaxID=13658 RepID=A0A915HGQ7_ROMCU
MASVSTQTDVSAGFFVIVSGAKKGPSNEKYELPLNTEGSLKLETLRVTFPGVSALQYKNPESGIMRVLKEEKGLIMPPPEGWGKTEFSICQPPDNKRPATEPPPTQAPPSKVGRPLLSTPGGVPPPALMDLNGGAAPQGQQQHFGGGPPQQQMMNGNNGFNGPMMDFQNDDFKAMLKG